MIHIVLPYKEGANYYRLWAHEEDTIDFRADLDRATRCTVCFAAEELVTYLNRIGLEAKVTDEPGEESILLKAVVGDGQGFSIHEDGKQVTISGDGRKGLLYGVYELLEAQGIRWYSPWDEYVPEKVEALQIPECKHYEPTMYLGRGFEFEGPLKDSAQLFLWMARNKMNMAAYRANTWKFQRKLGMEFKAGGHIFEKILDPDKATETGQTMLEAHPDWYGQREDEITTDNALHVQFCMSNTDLMEYLFQHLLERMQTIWAEADRLDIWGFDTWGGTCQCEKCKALGNGTDQTLNFFSYLRTRIDEETEKGVLKYPVRMVFCSYEGTTSLLPPEKKVPENLKTSGDYVAFAPILRCYEHEMHSEECCYNSYYDKVMTAWQDMPMMILEYYNVSKFEDLSLLFADKIEKDLKYYAQIGITGMTYMHLPMLEWGMRTQTQYLFAKLSWDKNEDVSKLLEKYFIDLYGPFADTARKAYSLVEEASKHCSSWRAWCGGSVLSNLLNWDGVTTTEPLYRDDHLGNNAVAYGHKSVELLKQAQALMEEIQPKADLLYAQKGEFVCGIPLNPTDNRFKQKKNFLSNRISTDIRGLHYSIDVYLLTTLFVEYYEALEQENETEQLWDSIKNLATKMTHYSYSVKFAHPLPELNVVDALERSGLKDVYYRCLAGRIN